MNSKERIRCTLEHKQPDKMAVDFGGFINTGIQAVLIEKLREYYGLEKHPVKLTEPYSMYGMIEDDLKDVLGVDCAGFTSRNTFFGTFFPADSWKEMKVTVGEYSTIVLVPEKFSFTEDGKGGYYAYPQGDTSVSPSGHMLAGSHCFDGIIRQEPIDEDNLDPEDNLEEYSLIDEDDIEYLKNNIAASLSSERAVGVNFGGSGLGDATFVPGISLRHPKGIRNAEEWYISMVSRQDYLHAVFSKQTDIAIENIKRYNEAIGDMIDIVYICGTDFGTQIGQFCSPDTFSELYVPYYKKINDWIHDNTNWKTFKHSCGAVEPLIPLFIECGFDILNPVQCTAKGMEPKHLKDTYGDKITFWGGGIDTTKTLPFGTKEEVREQVLSRCEVFAKDGGFVFNAICNVQAITPVENFVAMIDALREFNGEK